MFEKEEKKPVSPNIKIMPSNTASPVLDFQFNFGYNQFKIQSKPSNESNTNISSKKL